MCCVKRCFQVIAVSNTNPASSLVSAKLQPISLHHAIIVVLTRWRQHQSFAGYFKSSSRYSLSPWSRYRLDEMKHPLIHTLDSLLLTVLTDALVIRNRTCLISTLSLSHPIFQLSAASLLDPFRIPVDWEGMELHDYPLIVKRPMDLGTIKVSFL